MPKVKETTTKETKTKAVPAKEKAVKAGVETKKTPFSVPVYLIDGKDGGNLELPKEVFGVEVNKQLIAQAVRVYLNNLKGHFSNTKTRGEVSYSTRKMGAQKGSGHARHGSLGAPIYVGGGIALGPKSRKVVLDLPQKMKLAALKSALSFKLKSGEVAGIDGLDKTAGKTKEVQKLIDKLAKDKVLIVLDGKNEKVYRAVRNIPGSDALMVDQLNALHVLSHKTVLVTKEAVEKLVQKGQKKEAKA